LARRDGAARRLFHRVGEDFRHRAARPPVDLSAPKNLARSVLGLYDNASNFTDGTVPPGALCFTQLWNPSCPQQDRRCYRCFTGFHAAKPEPCYRSASRIRSNWPCSKLPSGPDKPASHFFTAHAISSMKARLTGDCPAAVKAAGGEANWAAFRAFLHQ
jgi:hypothetical protein